MVKRFVGSSRRKLFIEPGPRLRLEPPLDLPGYTMVEMEFLLPPQPDESDVFLRFYDIAPWWVRFWRALRGRTAQT